MGVRKIGYLVIIILAFVLGMQVDINFETSQIVNSDDIAIVNNDQRIDYMDQSLKFGDEVIKQIEYMDTDYNYTVVSSAEASQGLVSGKYAAVITIPSNLTTSVLSINTETPVATTINYELNSRLTNKSKQKVENELNTILGSSQNNLTYMYVYSIFDSLHDTQEGIETVTENDKPVYEFLEQLLEINVVTNHEYELEENNSDSFSEINLSEQLTEFNQIITNYKQDIQEVISVYKVENSESSQIINGQISKYEENTEGLNDKIDNVEDTLQTVVDANEQYTEDEYSITDTRGDIQAILQTYYSQLTDLNKINKTNDKLNGDSAAFKEFYDDLNQRTPYIFYNNLLTNRNDYYSQVSNIDGCLNGSSDEIETCLAENIDSFTSEYSDYETLLNNFEQEKQYAETLSYYIRHIGSEEAKNDAKQEHLSIETEFESSATEQIEEEIIEPTITVSKYQTIGYSDDYMLLTVDNIKSDFDSVTIDIEKTNIASIETVEPTNTNLAITNGNITLDDMDPTKYNFLLKITKEDLTQESQLSLSYGEQLAVITTPKADIKLDSTYTYNYDDQKLIIDYQYLVDTADVLTYVNTGLTSYIENASIINQSEPDTVALTSNGFTIDPSTLDPDTNLSFSIELNLNSKLGNGIFTDEYRINDVEYQSPFVVEDKTSSIDTGITIYDDPYYVDSATGDIEKVDNDLEVGDATDKEDDYVSNKTLEPGEEVGIKYEITYNTNEQPNISELQFDIVTSDLAEQITSDSVIGVELNGDNIAYNPTVSDNLVTIDLLETTIPETEDGETYTYEFGIYLNTQVKALNEVLSDRLVTSEDDNLVVSNNQISIVTDSYQSEYDSYVSRDLDLSWGAIDSTVTYTVDEDTCAVYTRKLEDCQFEAGETVKRQITITNNSNKPAAGIKVTEDFDNKLIDYEGETIYKLAGTKEEINLSETIANSYIETYSEYLPDSDNPTATYEVSLPAYSTLEIRTSLKIDEYISGQEDVDITQVITQYGINKGTASKSISILPIVLQLSDLQAKQIVDDEIITANEGLKLSFKMTNSSLRGISRYNNVVLSNSIPGIIDKVEVVSVEDEDWRDVDYTSNISGNTLEINVDKQLKPQEGVLIEVKVLFNDLSGASGAGKIVIQSFRESAAKPDSSAEVTTELEYDYALSGDSYLELARDQLANRETVPGEKYSDSFEETMQTVNDREQLNNTILSLSKYIFDYNDYYALIDSYTTLDNSAILIIKRQLSQFGLGYEDKDDEDYLALYDYCQDNNELSCTIINLYNKIYTIEDQDKQYFTTLLNTLNPSIEDTIGTKVDNDGNETDNPTNIGADFNGTNTCEESEIDSEVTKSDSECIEPEPGIWNRIDIQKQDIDTLEDDIDLILDNEVEEVDEEPYKVSLAKNSDEMNNVMDKVESENNQLFDEKLNIYNDNYTAVLEYLQEVSEDESYIDAVDKFTSEEDARQVITNEILVHTYELMPNTYLDGMPNKLVYSFIANPLNVEENTDGNVLAATTAEKQINMVYFYIGGFLTLLTAIMGAIFYKINKGV